MSNKTEKSKLKDLGYNTFFESSRLDLGLTKYSIARVTAEHKGLYKIQGIDGEYLASITGKQIYKATKREDYPAVGDWVGITKTDKNRAIIRNIFPRKTILKKKYSDKQDTQIIATNIDTAFVVESMDRDYNLNRFERYLVLINEGKIKPIIILNKIDLLSDRDLSIKINQIKQRFNNIEIILTSTVSKGGLCELVNYIKKGQTYCFLGSSGVGKSSLINKLLEKDNIKTNKISVSTGRGKHTTTAREMYFLSNGGIVIDNPGTREVGIADSSIGIENVFDEISDISGNCKYSDCTHTHEPGCAVLKALKDKKFNEDKYQNYVKIKKENEYFQMNKFEKRNKDRKFGRFVKKALDQRKNFK